MLQKIFPALGTVNHITVYGKCSRSILEDAKQRVLELHQRFSIFNPDSEISLVNQSAGKHPVEISEETVSLLELAQEYAAATNGTFDVTAGPMSRLWKKAIRSSKVPTQTEAALCKAQCGFTNLQLDRANHTAFLTQKGMQIDLGGIAKGYAADEVQHMLQMQGIANARINLGGTVVVWGQPQRIGIQNPFQKTGSTMAEITVQNKAIVTSGVYEQCFFHEGKRLHHIVDPRTGWPSCSGLVSVTLIGDRAVQLDALATAVCCLGVQGGMPILKRYGAQAIFVTENGSVQVTPNLHQQIAFCA